MHLVHRNFAALKTDKTEFDIALCVLTDSAGYRLTVEGEDQGVHFDASELIYEVEGRVVIQAQLLQPQLVFMHASALEMDGKAILLVGESGAGKSTLCWGLTQCGFRYLSDELAPLSAADAGFEVESYGHALCLKQCPPAAFELPVSAFFSGRTWHVPVSAMAAGYCQTTVASNPMLAHIFFVDRESEPVCTAALTRAEVTHRLYPQILNALAHPGKGLLAATEIARSATGYTVNSRRLQQACHRIHALVKGDS